MTAPAFLSPRPFRPSPHQSLREGRSNMSSSDFRDRSQRSHSAEAAAAPTSCPACQSPSISTTARNPDETTYWRCAACGEIWNVSRREAAGPAVRRWR